MARRISPAIKKLCEIKWAFLSRKPPCSVVNADSAHLYHQALKIFYDIAQRWFSLKMSRNDVSAHGAHPYNQAIKQWKERR